MKIIILLAVFILISCQETIVTPEEKLFDPQDLPLLGLEDLENFWGDNKVYDTNEFDNYPNYQLDENKFWDDRNIKPTSDYLHYYQNYLDGIALEGEVDGYDTWKEICVSVFKSQNSAIEAVEFHIYGNITAIFSPGQEHNIIKDKWWYMWGCGWGGTIIVNHYNTVITVSTNNNTSNTILLNTAAEITRRIDFLTK